MAGALIDTSNPLIPFIGGTLVGILVGGPVIDAVGGLLGSDSDAAYAYHSFKHGGMRGGGRRRHMMHPPVMPLHKLRPVTRRDFEKEYTNVEQTYSNQIAIRH